MNSATTKLLNLLRCKKLKFVLFNMKCNLQKKSYVHLMLTSDQENLRDI